jgi:hypothetical protein
MQILLLNTDISERYPVKTLRTDDTDGCEQDVCVLEASGDLAARELMSVRTDDFLEAWEEGYTTGRLYVDAASQTDGVTTVYARGMSAKGTEKGWASFENVTLLELMHLAASDLNMGYQQFGIEDQKYERLIRKGETWMAFLRRILRLESAVLKCAGGKLTAVSIPWAQNQNPVRTYEITSETAGCLYTENFEAYRECVLSGIDLQGKAVDTAVPGDRQWKPGHIQPQNAKQGKRWAQGELLAVNRMCSTLRLDLTFTPGIAAMSRVDITGMSVTKGQWIASRIEQDMIQRTSRLYLRPCITTIQ